MVEPASPEGFAALDWIVVVAYLALALGAGVAIGRRSRGSTENFFLSGRSLPWWLAGTSMVATSFASDTPLVVSSWTRTGGVSGNWRWWCYVLGTLLVVVLFSRLWRRSAVMTDVEFMELRYSGRPARALRGFKSVYQCIFMHCFAMGWVILGMTKVLVVLFDLGEEPLVSLFGWGLTPAWAAMLGCTVLAMVYSEVCGLWGVVMTDFVQFGFALLGSIVLMFTVVDEFGGMGAMVDALQASPVAQGKLSTAPPGDVVWTDTSTWTTDVWQFVIFVGVVWFANKNADGSGVTVQRILAAKNERHAWLATLWYAVAHYAIRPWPWILVALASLLVLPPAAAPSPVDGVVASVDAGVVVIESLDGVTSTVAVPDTGVEGWAAAPVVEPGDAVVAGQAVASTDDELAYPLMMRRYLPAGLLGLLAASFLAAFMSTIDTHVNIATSYLVNDLYKRFLRPGKDERHYVRAGRFIAPVVMVTALVFAAASDSVRGMFDDFTALFAGVGIVYVLRWTWWRINAWTEISALVASGLATWSINAFPGWSTPFLPGPLVEDGAPVFAGMLIVVVAVSLAVSIPVTLLTAPVDRERLQVFHDRVRPPGLWGPLRTAGAAPTAGLGRTALAWLGLVLLVMAAILVPGDLILADGEHLLPWLGVAAVGAVLLALRPSEPSRHGPRPS